MGQGKMGDSQQLIMTYGTVSAAGQAHHDIATNIAVVSDRTAPGCVAAALAYPTWASSHVVRDLHAKHTQHLDDQITAMYSTADSIQGSVVTIAGADNTSARDAEGIVPGGI
jgi:hypothetical protein